MWTAVVGIIGGIVTLLVKAVIDAGSAEHRARQAIIADIELLDVIPEDLDATTLRARIQARLVEYSRPADTPQSTVAKQFDRTDRRMRLISAGILGTAGASVAGGIAAVVSSLDEARPAKDPETSTDVWILFGVMLATIVVTVAFGLRTYFRMRRLSAIRFERLLAERRR